MATFVYEAVDATGKSKKGQLEAADEAAARDQLKGRGLFPTTLAAKVVKGGAKAAKAVEGRERAFTIGGGVSQKELTMFTRQFSTLIEAGLPVVRALDILEQMLRPGGLRNCVMDVRDDVEQGSSLSEALAKSPQAFDELYVSMIRAGEAGGLLGQILNRLADFREKSQKLKRQIVGALVYPIAVLTIAGAILALIITMIVPKFKEMFDGMGVEMPWLTSMLLDFADLMLEYWYLLPLVPAIVIVSAVGIRKSYIGRRLTDQMLLHVPIFGLIVSKSTISRFCRTLGELSSAGVPILDALGILKTSIGNLVVAEAVADIHASIREGENIADPMRRSGVFDLMVVNMVEVGEETGELDKMLMKIADTFDNEVDVLVSSMMSLLEPFLIVGLGGVVGFIVIALFMPLIAIMENMS